MRCQILLWIYLQKYQFNGRKTIKVFKRTLAGVIKEPIYFANFGSHLLSESPEFEFASTSVSFSLACPLLELLPLLFFGLDAMKKLKVPSLSSII
jgi:hypothetical protein